MTNFIREFDKDFVARYHIDHPDVVEQGLYKCEERAEFVYHAVLSTKTGTVYMQLLSVGFGYCDTIEDFVADVAWALDMDREVVRRRCYHAAVFDDGDEDHL